MKPYSGLATASHLHSSDDPLVTIVMSVHNAEAYLRCSLESLLGQTYKHLQIVVINDGSTDGSRQIVDSYQDDRIEFIDRMTNIGLTRSLNQGLAIARGQYIARHDADDISVDTRIAEQVAYFQANPHVDILGTGVKLFDGRKTLRRVTYDDCGSSFREQLLHFINPLPHPTLMFRKKVLDVLKGYNEYFLLSQDYDFLLRASEVFTIGSLQKSLVKLRFTHSSLTHEDTRQLKFGLAALICAHRRSMGRCDYSQKQHEEWSRFLQEIDAYIHEYHLGQRFRARTYLKKATFALGAYQLGNFLTSLFRAVMSDATCLTRRGIGMRIPKDIQVFLTNGLCF